MLILAVSLLCAFTNAYKRIEKLIIIFVSLIGFSFLFEIGIAKIDWGAAAVGWVKPSFPAGSMPVMAAATLYQGGNGRQIDDLTVAGKMLSPLMGNAATVVFALALLLAGISSSITAGMAGGTIFSGIFNQPYDTKTKETKAGILLTMILAAVVILFISQPFKGLIYSQMLLAIQLPITIFTQIYLTSSEKVMGKYVNSRRLNFLLLVIAVIVTGLNIALLFV